MIPKIQKRIKQQQKKQMYQNIKTTKIKIKQHQPQPQLPQNINTHSIRLIDFNHQWTHRCSDQLERNQAKKNHHQVHKSERKHDKYCFKQQNDTKITKNHQANTQYVKQTNNFQNSLFLIPKKKAFSHKEQNEDLAITSTKLKNIKLPSIKKLSREDCIIKRINIQKLQEINIIERIKHLKPQDRQNLNPDTQFITQSLKSKAQDIRKLNHKLKKTRNPTKVQSGNIVVNQSSNIIQRKFEAIQEQAKSVDSVSLKVKNNLTTPEQINKSLQASTEKQVKNENEQDEKSQKIQIYDKKMKIGRKKKKEEDRIRAMLLKTLQKTKGTDYVAQQGSSQTKKSLKNSRAVNTQRSQSKQRQNQRANLILVDQSIKQSNLKQNSLKKNESQKLKSSLLPKSRFSQQRQPSNYVKNKKFVQMVREVENRKKFFQQQLEEIKEEKTLTKQKQDQNNQPLNQINMEDRSAEEQTENNQFLPHNNYGEQN